MTSFPVYPAINLRMKWTSFDKNMDACLLTDQIDVMMQLDRQYRCDDYLLFQPPSDQAIDSLARTKMISWKYKVCDHYNISRECVSTSTNLLDRFVGLYTCDRSTYKLAAMTCLYMACKINNHLLLQLKTLVELSRGEFLCSDVLEMESIVLQTLQWKVSPVTAHSLIHSLVQLVPVSSASMLAAIHDRAIFFAELCLFDYSYVTRSRLNIAVAAILNALEGVGEGLTIEESEQAFMETIRINTNITISSEHMDHLREDLWYVYSLSAQYQEEDMQMCTCDSSVVFEKQHPAVAGAGTLHSPISVMATR